MTRSPTSTAGRFVLARGITGISEQSATSDAVETAHAAAPVAHCERIAGCAHAHVPTGWK